MARCPSPEISPCHMHTLPRSGGSVLPARHKPQVRSSLSSQPKTLPTLPPSSSTQVYEEQAPLFRGISAYTFPAPARTPHPYDRYQRRSRAVLGPPLSPHWAQARAVVDYLT